MTPIVPERAIHTIFVKKRGIQESKKGIFKCYCEKLEKNWKRLFLKFSQFQADTSKAAPLNFRDSRRHRLKVSLVCFSRELGGAAFDVSTGIFKNKKF